MAKPSITKRTTKGAALTYSELDTNFQNLADATLTLTAGSGGTAVTADLNGNITIVAGTGITLTGNNTAKTLTITNSSLGANSFGKIVVAGQSDVDADTTSDTLTLAAGTGITLTTNASTDTVTITSSVTGVTNPLTSDLDLGNFKIIDSNGEAVVQSTQGLMVKSNTYANAELTITPGDILNATSRISTKEGVLVINTKIGASVASFITLDPDGNININATGGNSISIGSSVDGISISCANTSTSKVTIDSPIFLNNITTSERDALSPTNGYLIYNSSTGKFQGYAGGSWVNLH
jgi:hypothetical protein